MYWRSGQSARPSPLHEFVGSILSENILNCEPAVNYVLTPVTKSLTCQHEFSG